MKINELEVIDGSFVGCQTPHKANNSLKLRILCFLPQIGIRSKRRTHELCYEYFNEWSWVHLNETLKGPFTMSFSFTTLFPSMTDLYRPSSCSFQKLSPPLFNIINAKLTDYDEVLFPQMSLVINLGKKSFKNAQLLYITWVLKNQWRRPKKTTGHKLISVALLWTCVRAPTYHFLLNHDNIEFYDKSSKNR